MTKPSILVFDFGGVISRTLFETHNLTEKALGLSRGTLTWQGPFDPANDALWQSMQNDEISERAYWLQRTKETGKLIGKEWNRMEEFVIAARGADPGAVIRPEFLSTIERAQKGGHRLAILSNELDLFYGKEFREKLPFIDDFETVIDATYTKILKPDLRAYQFVCDAMKCQPEDCVFIDDQQRNIDGSIAFGMPSILFDVQNPQDSYNRALSLIGIE